MTALDQRQVLRVPGRLVNNPTQNGLDAGTFPYGGTEIGFFEAFDWCVDEEVGQVFSEYLSKNVATVRGATACRAEFDLTQFDTTALFKLYATGVGELLYQPSVGASIAPGLVAANNPVLFAPNDPTLHPALVILNPSWHQGRGKRVPWDLNRLRKEGFTIHANDDTTGRTFVVDYLTDLSLT